MGNAATTGERVDLVSGVRVLLSGRLAAVAQKAGMGRGPAPLQLTAGKMLRTRLMGRLAPACPACLPPDDLTRLSAAVELVHTASLCHDDVIDNAFLRRSAPTLWRETTPSAAVLIGDLLLCEAVDLLLQVDNGSRVPAFVAKVREVCAAEAEQELRLRGRRVDLATCLRVARQKTGPLFAFAAQVCGGDDEVLCAALEEAGYRVGAAYQLADDLLDAVGTDGEAGKTLGTDRLRGKFTLACEVDRLRERIGELCRSAADCVRPWPRVRTGLADFYAGEMLPVFQRYGHGLPECLSEVR